MTPEQVPDLDAAITEFQEDVARALIDKRQYVAVTPVVLMHFIARTRSLEARLATAERDKERRGKAIEEFLAKWEVCRPHIDGPLALQQLRTGIKYTGPTLVDELDGLRAALRVEPKEEGNGKA